MRCARIIQAIVVTMAVLAAASVASASLFEPVSDVQLVCEATDVIHGQITDVQAAWDAEHAAIWTTATVQVGEALRGPLSPGALVTIKEVGGTVDGYTIKAEGFPSFQGGQEVVLLLRPWEDGSGAYRVWGYGRGLFAVDRTAGREPTTRRYDVVESGRATMHTDQIPPTPPLSALNRQLSALATTCERGGR